MKIKKTLSKLVSFDDRESKYIYRIIENTVKNRQAFGIEIEKQDLNCGEVINLERDTINIVASNETIQIGRASCRERVSSPV